MKRRDAMAVLALGAAGVRAQAAARVGPALERPALPVRDPARAVLLGAAMAGPQIVVVGERGLVLRSTDGGRRWTQQPTPVSVTLTAVRFADERRGWAVGHGATVLATEDGGDHWTRRLDGVQAAGIELAAAQAAGDAAALKSAERLRVDGPDKPLLDLLDDGGGALLAVGAYGLAFASRDGGGEWVSWKARLDNPKELHLYAVRRRGERIVVAGEQGLVRLSDDGGSSFRRLALPYAGSFFTAELPSAGAIVVAGLRGNAWRSDDGGTTWQALAAPMPATFTASALLADASLLLANQAGLVLAARGGALVPLPGPALPPLNGLLPLPGGALLALSMQGAHVLPKVSS